MTTTAEMSSYVIDFSLILIDFYFGMGIWMGSDSVNRTEESIIFCYVENAWDRYGEHETCTNDMLC